MQRTVLPPARPPRSGKADLFAAARTVQAGLHDAQHIRILFERFRHAAGDGARAGKGMLRAVRGARHGDRVGDGFLPVAHSCQAGGGHAHRCAVGRAAAIAPALHAGHDGGLPRFSDPRSRARSWDRRYADSIWGSSPTSAPRHAPRPAASSRRRRKRSPSPFRTSAKHRLSPRPHRCQANRNSASRLQMFRPPCRIPRRSRPVTGPPSVRRFRRPCPLPVGSRARGHKRS